MGEQLNTKKELENIQRNRRALGKSEELLKTQCTHTKHGQLTITPTGNNSQKGGTNTYICKQCGKDVLISMITDQEIRRACEIIDIACDTVKITLDRSREDDDDIFKKVSKLQFRVRNEIIDFYNAAAKRNRKGGGNGKGNRDNNNSSSGTWSRPNSI